MDSVSFQLGARELPDDFWAQRDAAACHGVADTAVLGEKGPSLFSAVCVLSWSGPPRC